MGIIQNLQESLGHVLNNMSRVVFTEAIRTRQYRTCRQRCDLLGNSDWYLIYCVIYLYLTWKSNKARVQSKRMQQKFFKLELLRVFYIKLSKVRVWNLSTNADNSWKCLLYGNRAIVAKWPETQISCITEHPGFQSICLDFWVLETAYYAYRQQQGTDNHTGNE